MYGYLLLQNFEFLTACLVLAELLVEADFLHIELHFSKACKADTVEMILAQLIFAAMIRYRFLISGQMCHSVHTALAELLTISQFERPLLLTGSVSIHNPDSLKVFCLPFLGLASAEVMKSDMSAIDIQIDRVLGSTARPCFDQILLVDLQLPLGSMTQDLV